MKRRKLVALLMALVMLLGMVPVAQAQVIWCPDLGLSHSWGPAEYDYGPCDWGMHYCTVCGTGDEVSPQHNWTTQITLQPGCDTTGYKEIICADCHSEQGNPETIPALGHDWGSWGWAHGSAPSCTEGAWQVRNCKRCGQMEDKWVEAGSHQWSGWNTVSAGSCVAPAKEQRSCSVCGATESRDGAKGGHSFGSWAVTQNATCFRVGKETRTCKHCSYAENRDTGYGPHQYGEWITVKEPTCMEAGKRQSTCAVCGVTSTNTTDKADHIFGEWYVVAEPHVGVPGLEQRDCTYGCGTFEQREIPPLSEGDNIPPAVELPTVVLEKHVMNTPANGEFFVPGEAIQFGLTLWVYGPGRNKASSEFIVNEATIFDPLKEEPVVVVDMGGTWNLGNSFLYTVTEEDALRGYVENTGYATWVYVENGQPGRVDSNTVTTPCGAGPLSADGLSLTLALSSTPANGTHFVVGEEVAFTETWSNGTGKTLYPFSVSIWTCGTPVFGSEIDQICSWFAEDGGGPVAPGASGSHTLTVTVTEADVARGEIYAMAELLSTVQDGPDLENVTTPFVTAPCGPDNSGDFGLVNGLTVTKQVTSTPANGSYYVPGETVTYEVCVKNNGEPLNMLCVSDWMRDGTFKYGTIETGEDVTYPISYTVIELDAISGSVSNISFAEAVAANGDPVLEYSNSVTVPCGFPEGSDIPFGIFHSLAVVKVEESMPLNGEYYTEGEVIHYSITYTNDGELPLTDVQVWDTMDINTTIGHAETLQPGESRTCYYQHTVTAADVDAGIVLNMAQANYPIPGDEGYVGVNSNLVSSKTSPDGIHCVVSPIFPTPGEDPEYDPGTGWFPPDAGEETPDFGTIDTDALHGGETYCVRTITGRDNVSATYETTFCTEHADTQSSALIMAQAAATPDLQAQAAAYAVALWRTEVETLYQKIFEAADPTAKTIVMTEYVRFLTDVANYEAMLKILYPDQPALVALKVAEIWENKSVDLCYDAHATAAERKDSLLAVTPTAGSSAVQCTCVTTSETNGQKTDVQSYCPVHSFPFSMIDALLQGNDTAESWTMVRRIWGVELTSAYNKIYEAMGDNKLLAMAEYNALTQWMMAREASLIALYPNNPEVVAQAMVKTIMDRVNDLCQVSR